MSSFKSNLKSDLNDLNSMTHLAEKENVEKITLWNYVER